MAVAEAPGPLREPVHEQPKVRHFLQTFPASSTLDTMQEGADRHSGNLWGLVLPE